MGYMIIDGQKVEFNDEKNVLQVIRKAGIELPTFCYHSVLLLANQDRDCTTCEKNARCKLQELALRFGIKNVRFKNEENNLPIDDSSASIVRNPNKCIMCGDCVRMCEEVQGIGVLGFAHRGSKIQVAPAFNKQLSEVDCVNCGQCTTVCPTGALVIKNETQKAWDILYSREKRAVAQIAPAVRVAIGEEFGLPAGEIAMGKVVAALKKLGFDEVYDTALAADLTVMEESKEFTERLENNGTLPLFTSCCPGWVKFVENRFSDLLPNVSSCKSPQQMFGSVVKEHFKKIDQMDGKQTFMVSIMPCTAKKYEAARSEYENEGIRDVDMVLTTQELVMMIKEAGIMFNELEPEATDMPFGLASGAGVIFGVTGGVAEAVLRRFYSEKTSGSLKELEFVGVRGMEGIKEASVEIGGKTISIAVVHGLKNVDDLMKMIKNGEKSYHFVEVMACPGGCIGGAGQPLPHSTAARSRRAKGIYKADKASQIKRSEENPMIMALYNGVLKGKKHILHNPHNH